MPARILREPQVLDLLSHHPRLRLPHACRARCPYSTPPFRARNVRNCNGARDLPHHPPSTAACARARATDPGGAGNRWSCDADKAGHGLAFSPHAARAPSTHTYSAPRRCSAHRAWIHTLTRSSFPVDLFSSSCHSRTSRTSRRHCTIQNTLATFLFTR